MTHFPWKTSHPAFRLESPRDNSRMSLHGSYPETAFQVGEMLNGVCSCCSFDRSKNVVLIVINRAKMPTKGE